METRSSSKKQKLGSICLYCSEPVQELDSKKVYPKTLTQLGKGAYGYVRLRENNQGERVAVKYSTIMKSTGGGLTPDFVREVSALRALKGHPNIVKMIGFSINEGSITLELAEQSLSDALKNGVFGSGGKDTLQIKNVIFQIIKGMRFMNDVGIWHRDLKPQNILIFPGDVIKITDFGMARGGPFQWISITGVVYTLWYRAPEILLQEVIRPLPDRNPSIYTSKAEVFAIGLCLWDLLCGSDYKVAQYLRGDSVSTQLWKFIRGLGFSLFDWCVTNPIGFGCTAQTFFQGYARTRKMETIQANMDLKLSGKPELPVLTEDQYKGEIIGLTRLSDFECLNKVDINKTFSEELKSLFRGLLHPDPKKRITLDKAIEHPYFSSMPIEYEYLSKEEIKSKQVSILEARTCVPVFPEGTEINVNMWKILTEWLFEVNMDYRGAPATLSLCYQLLLCYLKSYPLIRNRVQLVGCSCYYLASLYMEAQPVMPEDMAYISAGTYSKEQIIEKTNEVFLAVGAMMHLPTPMITFASKLKDLHLTSSEIKPYAKEVIMAQISGEVIEGQISIEEKINEIVAKVKAKI